MPNLTTKLRNGGAGGILLAGMLELTVCPFHGIPAGLSLIGSSSVFAETRIGQVAQPVHEFYVDTAAKGVALLHPDPYNPNYSPNQVTLESLSSTNSSELENSGEQSSYATLISQRMGYVTDHANCDPKHCEHGDKYKPEIYQLAHSIVSNGGRATLPLSAGIFAIGRRRHKH